MKSNAPEQHAWLDALMDIETDDCIEWPWIRPGRYPQTTQTWTRKPSHIVLVMRDMPRPEPPANHALHSCDNKACLNYRHLRWGTHQQNMKEAWARGLVSGIKCGSNCKCGRHDNPGRTYQ